MTSLALQQFEDQSSQSKEEARTSSHLWVCSSPFFQTSLYLATPMISAADAEVQTAADSAAISHARLYDADGSLCNEITVQFPRGQVGVLEMEPLMESCKIESGLTHAHLHIESCATTTVSCRLHSREGACIMSPPRLINEVRRTFFPLLFAEERSNFLCVVNHSGSEAILRGKLFCGKRSPEVSWQVPAHGTRAFALHVEFAEYVDLSKSEFQQGYLRLGVRGDQTVGVQIIERLPGLKEGSLFVALS